MSYQLIIPLEVAAERVTLPDPHLELGVVLVMVAIVRVVLAEIWSTGSPDIPPYSTI